MLAVLGTPNAFHAQIMEAAEKLSQMVADHPATARYKAAQKAVTEDPEAGRLLADFDQQWVPLHELPLLDVRPRAARPVLMALSSAGGLAAEAEPTQQRAAAQWSSAHSWVRKLLDR